jgi:hypothetical protein
MNRLGRGTSKEGVKEVKLTGVTGQTTRRESIEEVVGWPYTQIHADFSAHSFRPSTWIYEGWLGQVYKKQYAKSEFA